MADSKPVTPAPLAPASRSFAAVVVTYNSASDLDTCLDSLLGEPELSRVVVVDNGSADETHRIVQRRSESEPRIELIRNAENLGFSRACNLGLRRCSEPFVLLLNPDAALLPESLAHLRRGFEEWPGAGILGLKVWDWDGTTLQLSCRAFPDHSTALFHRYSILTRLWPGNRGSQRYLGTGFDHERVAPFDWVSGCAMGLRRELLERIGMFDEDYFLFCEDVDLCRRAKDAGFEVLYYPMAQARHRIGGSSRSASALSIRERHRSMWIYYKKHMRGGWLLDLVTYAGIQARCRWQLLRTSGKR